MFRVPKVIYNLTGAKRNFYLYWVGLRCKWVGFGLNPKPNPLGSSSPCLRRRRQLLLLLLPAAAATGVATAAQPRGGATTSPVPAPLRRCSGAAPACQPTGRREMGRRAGASSLPLPAQRRPINGAAVAGQPVSGRRSDRRGREVKASPIITERGEGVRSPLRYQNPNQIQRE